MPWLTSSSAQTSAMLQVLCQVLKNGQPHVIVQHWTKLYRLLAVHDSARDATIDKARIKLAGRLALLKLTEASSKNAEVPGEVEVVLSEMMLSLEAEVSTHKGLHRAIA